MSRRNRMLECTQRDSYNGMGGASHCHCVSKVWSEKHNHVVQLLTKSCPPTNVCTLQCPVSRFQFRPSPHEASVSMWFLHASQSVSRPVCHCQHYSTFIIIISDLRFGGFQTIILIVHIMLTKRQEHYNICNSSSISASSSWSTQIGCLSMGSQRTFPYTRHLRKNGRSNARVYVSIVPISRRWRQSSRHLYCVVETHLSAAYPSPLLILEHALASFPSTTSNRSDLEQTHAQQLRRKMQRHASGIVRPTREVSPLKGQDSAHLSTQRVVLT